MSDNDFKYIWRCARCSSHFANITKSDGMIKQEKKCPKCKSLNLLTLTSQEIIIHCKFFDSTTNDYNGFVEGNYSYPPRSIDY